MAGLNNLKAVEARFPEEWKAGKDYLAFIPRDISKVGRPPTWESPEIMWNCFVEYAQWCEDNPYIKVEFLGKDAVERHIPKKRIMTLMGFCGFSQSCTITFYDYQKKPEYSSVCSVIKDCIRGSNIALGAADLVNANIISRLEGLADRKDINQNTNQKVVLVIPSIDLEGNPILPIDEADYDFIPDSNPESEL